MKLGIDFGTTNSAVAVAGAGGVPRILELIPGEPIQRTVIHCDPDGVVRFGNAAFRSYEEHDLQGRFLRSLKAFLPQEVPRLTLGPERLDFHQIVGYYLRFLLERTEAVTGQRPSEVIVGRPVRFHADPEKDAFALKQLEQALAFAGITDWRLQMEPVAAAHLYERGLDAERLVLVGDFGGGTSDFAILRVGPQRLGQDRAEDVLGTSGVAKAGDALDGRFMEAFLMEYFGRGAGYRARYTDEIKTWNHSATRHIKKLYDVHRLRTPTLEMQLDRIEDRMVNPTIIRRLRRLIFDDLGFPMAWAIEATKREFSESERTTFQFVEFYSKEMNIAREVDRDTFAAESAAILAEYDGAIDEVLDVAGLTVADIDEVFLTGGTSQLPFIRGIFATRFGADRLRHADAFSSVCAGLALS